MRDRAKSERLATLRRALVDVYLAPKFDDLAAQGIVADLRAEIGMTERRFTDKPALDPGSVRSLPSNHPAMSANRSLFPSTVVEVTETEPESLLVSGRNNRKLGETIAKGKFKSYALYGLSLEERATCPADCAVRAVCYGNGMQMARRHRIGNADVFFDRLGFEIVQLIDQHGGLMVRLHVLGDFPSVEYVAFWADALAENEKLACYGYTARKLSKFGGDEIGDAIFSVMQQFPDRFRIRFSGKNPQAGGAVVIDRVPDKPKIKEGLVCPAQTDATACCASCGLCWEYNFRNECIVFVKHGPKSLAAALETETAKAPALSMPTRPVAPIDLPANMKPATVDPKPPETRIVRPEDLRIEAAYQRDLTPKSIKLIRKIVTGWDWTKFKPPVVADTSEGLFVIDGQHTAIAAATHQYIKEIPVLVVAAPKVTHRAESFVSHNRDRLAMSQFQIFHAKATAGNAEAMEMLKVIVAAGASIPRSPAGKRDAKVGQIIALGEVRSIFRAHGADVLRRLLGIAVKAEQAPLNVTVARALRLILTEEFFAPAASLPDDRLAGAIRSIGEVDAKARALAMQNGMGRHRAAAALITEAAGVSLEAAA